MTIKPTPGYSIPAPLVQLTVDTIGQMPALHLLAQNPPITVMDFLLQLRQITQIQDAENEKAAFDAARQAEQRHLAKPGN